MNEIVKMIEKFQCPGCVHGSGVDCGEYNYIKLYQSCRSHTCATGYINNYIALGLPKGFNKPGFNPDGKCETKINIRIWVSGTHPNWDKLNLPVWALEENGYLFVRTYSPRVNRGIVDVIAGGKQETLCPNAIDVSTFLDQID